MYNELMKVYKKQVAKGYFTGTFENWCTECMGIEAPKAPQHERKLEIKDVKKELNSFINRYANYEVTVSVWEYDGEYDVIVSIHEDGEIAEELTMDTYGDIKKAIARRKSLVNTLSPYKAIEEMEVQAD